MLVEPERGIVLSGQAVTLKVGTRSEAVADKDAVVLVPPPGVSCGVVSDGAWP